MAIRVFKNRNNVTELHIDDVPFMTNDNVEIDLQKQLANVSYGNVLAGGMGFGLYQYFCLQNTKVKSVTTIELDNNIIEECKKHINTLNDVLKNNRHILIIGNFWEYTNGGDYNVVCCDIWRNEDFRNKQEWDKFIKHSKTYYPDAKTIGWHSEYFKQRR